MSYNCDVFKVKKIENLRIPLLVLAKYCSDWDTSVNLETNEITITGGEGTYIKGIPMVDGLVLLCTEIDCWGEGSGNLSCNCIEPILRNSSGTLVVSRVWESGDSLDKMTVIDGVITCEDFDL